MDNNFTCNLLLLFLRRNHSELQIDGSLEQGIRLLLWLLLDRLLKVLCSITFSRFDLLAFQLGVRLKMVVDNTLFIAHCN